MKYFLENEDNEDILDEADSLEEAVAIAKRLVEQENCSILITHKGFVLRRIYFADGMIREEEHYAETC